jgi:selenocysteine lyase/cysteine desulfurase
MNTIYTTPPRQSKAKQIHDMILGLDTLVELENKTKVPAINLDNAATTPPMKIVFQEIRNQMMYYSSIGRGIGQKSDHTNDVYTSARDTVLDFVGADKNLYSVFYVNNTTEGMNKLASALIDTPHDMVLSTRMEHHANDLPWRLRARTMYVEVDENGRLIVDDFEVILRRFRGRIKYVTVTAASNVTGYVNDIHYIAKIAHKYGALIIVDGAQIVSHRSFCMMGDTPEENIDFFVFSAHKMYSPFGGGAVVGLASELDRHVPKFYGGGMINTVTDQKVFFTDGPDRYEAGTPNFPGVVGMSTAMKILKRIGFKYISGHEKTLFKTALEKLEKIPQVCLYGDCENVSDRIGILVFTIKNMDNMVVAKKLADLGAIGVRHAAFCAHPYVRRLTGEFGGMTDDEGSALPPKGMIRVSFGMYNTMADVMALVNTVRMIAEGVKDEIPADAIVCAEYDTGEMEHRPCDRC